MHITRLTCPHQVSVTERSDGVIVVVIATVMIKWNVQRIWVSGGGFNREKANKTQMIALTKAQARVRTQTECAKRNLNITIMQYAHRQRVARTGQGTGHWDKLMLKSPALQRLHKDHCACNVGVFKKRDLSPAPLG